MFCDIKDVVDSNDYSTNSKKLDSIINMKNDCIPKDVSRLENYFYAINISKKYKQRYNEVIDLFQEYVLTCNHFEVVYSYFYFLETTNEKFDYLNQLMLNNYELTCQVLRRIVIDSSVKDIVIFKKMYCEACINIGWMEEYNLYTKSDFINLALKLAKELNAKQLYDSLIKIDQNIKKQLVQTMKKRTFKMPEENAIIFNQIDEKLRCCISKMTTVEEYIKFFVNEFYIRVGEHGFNACLSKVIIKYEETNIHPNSFSNLISWETYDGMKLVKSRRVNSMVCDFLRKMIILKVVIPIIQEGIKKVDKEEFIEYLSSSYFVFEEDKKDIEMALNFYFSGDYRSFIYYVVPNIEKILRNMLEFNEIPTYHNSQANPKYQQTFVLSDSLKKLGEEKILDDELIQLLREKLDDENFENYRNRLSHKLDEGIFSYECATDLLRILIVILFCYEKDDYINIVGCNQEEIDEILKKITKSTSHEN